MSACSLSVSPKPNTLMRCQKRPLVFENKSASSLQVTSGLSLPLRVAQGDTTTLDETLCEAGIAVAEQSGARRSCGPMKSRR